MSGLKKKKQRLALRTDRDNRKKEFMSAKAAQNKLIAKETDLLKMREIFTQDFYIDWD